MSNEGTAEEQDEIAEFGKVEIVLLIGLGTLLACAVGITVLKANRHFKK